MSETEFNRPDFGKLPIRERKAVTTKQEEWIRTEPLYGERSPALLVTPAMEGIDLVAWAENNRELFEQKLQKHGAILFRGFDVESIAVFEEFVGAVSGGALEYSKRGGPRHKVEGHVYTSTDYPPDQPIFPHNEGGFQPEFPLRLFFYSVIPATVGGETPIGDNRWITEQIPSEIKSRFMEKKVLYVRNFGSGFGLDWRTVFQTDDKAEIEEYCEEHDIEYEWYRSSRGDGECLRTKVVGPAVIRHPGTGESIWFNHATFFHVTSLPPQIRDGLLSEFDEEELPNNTFYGDGSPIEPDTLETLRGIYREAMVDHTWQEGDVMAIDNLLMVHARNTYSGERKLLVALADSAHWRDSEVQVD